MEEDDEQGGVWWLWSKKMAEVEVIRGSPQLVVMAPRGGDRLEVFGREMSGSVGGVVRDGGGVMISKEEAAVVLDLLQDR